MASLGSFKKGIVYTKGGLGQTGISTSTGAAPAPSFEFGNALSFDGVNDYVSIGTPVSMSSEATVNMWVKFSNLSTRLIVDTSNTAVIWTPTSTTVRVYCGGSWKDFVVPTMSLGTWYMITATRDAANGWRVYLNGTESTSGLQVRAGTFNVNRLGNLASIYSNIVLDELSILEGTTASDIQIASLYNSGNGANANTIFGSTSLYYRLNGSGTDITAIDDSGNSNTGTLNNFTGTYWVAHFEPPFEFANALSFDGVNDDVAFTSSVDKPALTSGFSFSMWVEFDSALGNEWILGSTTSSNMWFRIDSALVIFRSRSSGAGTTIWTVPAFSTGTWYHIAVSLVGTVNELWINGTKYTGDTDNYDNENISIDKIGRAGSSSYGQFVIDELAMQSGAGLSQADVDALYNGGAGAFATDVMTPDVYYRFNESEPSATTADSSGNENTGTVTGATFVAH